jgi:hypothetical protein
MMGFACSMVYLKSHEVYMESCWCWGAPSSFQCRMGHEAEDEGVLAIDTTTFDLCHYGSPTERR